jgi:tripartite-type tricarboxylate transporter receptor subunit TctC
MQDEEIRKRFMADGADPVFSKTPEEFATVIRSELAKWAQVARGAKIEPQ